MPTLYCPQCGYNLTGLLENQCPECGARFNADQLEQESRDAGAVIRKVRMQMLLLPLLYAALMPCWCSFPVSTTDRLSPVFWVFLIILISVIPVFMPPLWTGWTLGKQYARARLFRIPKERADSSYRSEKFYGVVFAIAQTILMLIYFGVGILLLFAFLNWSFGP